MGHPHPSDPYGSPPGRHEDLIGFLILLAIVALGAYYNLVLH